MHACMHACMQGAAAGAACGPQSAATLLHSRHAQRSADVCIASLLACHAKAVVTRLCGVHGPAACPGEQGGCAPTRMTLILMLRFMVAQKLSTPKMASGPSTVSCSHKSKICALP